MEFDPQGNAKMPCQHLKELYDVAAKHDLKIAASDIVRIVCRQCDEQEKCPTALTDGAEVIRTGQRTGTSARVI
ncbi:MAG: hypothetical protein AAF539_03875 [Planctomycetota bacterium]